MYAYKNILLTKKNLEFQRKDPFIRAIANVALTVNTTIIDREKFSDKSSVPRKNLLCKITYVANGKQTKKNPI